MTTDQPLILGGGMAGIAAAVALAEAGLRPMLVEARPYLGGRARSFVHPGSGDEIDNGQHLMMGCYRSTFRLLEMLGTRSLVELQPLLQVEFRDPDGSIDSLTVPSSLPAPLNVLAGMLRLAKLSLAERLRLLRVGVAARLGRPGADETVSRYLDRLGQSRRSQERLWNPIIIATLNTPPDQASARVFVEVMRRAFLGGRLDSQLAFPRAGLSLLTAPAQDYIETRGGSVLTSASITGLERVGDELQVHLREQPPLRSRQVVSALQQQTLRLLLPNELREGLPFAADPMPLSPIVSLYLWFDQELPEMPTFGALIGTSVQWMFNRRKIAGGGHHRHPGLISCTISAAVGEAAASGDDVVVMAERELRRAYPELAGARLADALVIKEKQATFAATPAAEAMRPGAVTSIPGFYLAGDWTATGLPGTIEGAVESGFRVAEKVIAKTIGERGDKR